jgi:hypothetical protein
MRGVVISHNADQDKQGIDGGIGNIDPEAIVGEKVEAGEENQ